MPPAVNTEILQLFDRNPGCAAVLVVPADRWAGPANGEAVDDLRLRSEGAAPFGGLDALMGLSGARVFLRGNLSAPEGLVRALELRKAGRRVLCMPAPADQLRRSEAVPLDARQLAARFFPSVLFDRVLDGGVLEELKSGRDTDALSLLESFLDSHDADTVQEYLRPFARRLAEALGDAAANRLFARLELKAGYRHKPSLGIYDHALQMAGGGQKYACTMAAALQDDYEITLISNKPVTVAQLESWYGLDLSRCRSKHLPLEFFESRKCEHIDQGMAKYSAVNPFEPVSEESKRYDIFMNVNMLTLVKPQSPVSVFLCHFPDSKRQKFFAVDDYTYIVANSRYTIEWLKKRWKLSPSVHIYPPIDMPQSGLPKEELILSVARFDDTGSKKQLELLEAFARLKKDRPAAARWRLVLAGGSFGRNYYLKRVMKRASHTPNATVLMNASLQELSQLYGQASIFWHACGLGTSVPEKIEHFGMATVEAMQSGCVPVVINKGGQREIVEPGVSGFLFDDLKGLCDTTERLISEPALWQKLSAAARVRAGRFLKPRFDEETARFFAKVHETHFKPLMSA